MVRYVLLQCCCLVSATLRYEECLSDLYTYNRLITLLQGIARTMHQHTYNYIHSFTPLSLGLYGRNNQSLAYHNAGSLLSADQIILHQGPTAVQVYLFCILSLLTGTRLVYRLMHDVEARIKWANWVKWICFYC